MLQYEVDAVGHRVVVRHGDGRIAFAFGAYGHGPGQFDTPLDAVPVSPEFFGEPHGPQAALSILTPWVAVADYGNQRIQFFECDGAYVGEIELEHTQAPCGLTWRAPALDVATPDGHTVRVHVAAGLLATTGRDRQHERADARDARRAWRVC